MEQRSEVLDDEKPPTRGRIHHNVELNGSSKASTQKKQHKGAERNTSEIGHLHATVLTKPSPGGNLHYLVAGLQSQLIVLYCESTECVGLLLSSKRASMLEMKHATAS